MRINPVALARLRLPQVNMDKPFVLLKAAMSLNGLLDDSSPSRLMLSNAQDRDAVDALRSTFDAIMVGATTVRRDNPSLLIRGLQHQQARVARSQPAQPRKVTLTRTGQLAADGRFFQEGDCEKIVYCPTTVAEAVQAALSHVATVVPLGPDMLRPATILRDLAARGIARLLLEGGSSMNHFFLQHGAVDAMRVAIAPFFVDPKGATALIGTHDLPQYDKDHRMTLNQVEMLGDMAILHYVLSRE